MMVLSIVLTVIAGLLMCLPKLMWIRLIGLAIAIVAAILYSKNKKKKESNESENK